MDTIIDQRINEQHSVSLPINAVVEERTFYNYIAAGNVEAILQLRRKFGGRKTDDPQNAVERSTLSTDPLRNEIYHLVVNCTLITYCCIAAGMPQEEALTLSDLFIRRADRCQSISDVYGVNDEMALEFASRMQRIRRGAPASFAVRKAIGYISDNISSRLTVEQIAKEVGYNRSHLAVIFKDETGQSISDYILSQKIDTAKAMITSGRSLSDTAVSLGFCSQSHFCKVFKQITGLTPKQFREQE